MQEQQELFNENEDINTMSRSELKNKFKELTGYSGYALDDEQLKTLIRNGNKDSAIAALSEAERKENETDRNSNYQV